jgi:chemotaxis protein MotB
MPERSQLSMLTSRSGLAVNNPGRFQVAWQVGSVLDAAMPKNTWTFAALLAAALALVLGFFQFRAQNRAVTEAEAAAAEARKSAEQAAASNAAVAGELEALRARAAELEQQVARAAEAQQGLEQQMRNELDSRDVTISELQGKLTVNILDRVLFDSGQSALKPEGQVVLLKVAKVLAQFPTRPVQVIGHTDNVPIRDRTAEGFTDNWALSAGRAVAAVRFLVERAGVDPRRLSAAGSGEFKPLADNTTAEGRAKNRRIAVVVLPEELGLTDLPRTNASSALPHSSTDVRPSP